MKANLWHSLEILSIQAALLTEWKRALGDDFAAARDFLRATQQQVDSYPCSHLDPCGCRHRVTFDSPEDISAVCDCEEGGCEPIFLRASDLMVYALDGSKLAAAIRGAFRFNELPSMGFEEIRSRLVGSWGIRRCHVFFNVPISEKGLLKEFDRLCAAVPDPFVLLTPTARFCTPMVQRALRLQGCAHMALAGIVTLKSPGVLELIPDARHTVDAVFGDFGKQIAQGKPLELAIARVEAKLDAIAKAGSEARNENPELTEDVARQALALVKELDTEQRLKEPSLLTVFHLYCVKELSAAQIASQCGCSKGTVIGRLRMLARKTGMPAGRLRRHSAQFERMEEEMGDWRAKEIHREALLDDGSDDHNAA